MWNRTPSFAREPGRLGDGLDRSELVVRVLERCEERPGSSDLRGEAIEIDPTVSVDGDDHDLEPVRLERVRDAAHGRMLDGADHDPGAELADRRGRRPRSRVRSIRCRRR